MHTRKRPILKNKSCWEWLLQPNHWIVDIDNLSNFKTKYYNSYWLKKNGSIYAFHESHFQLLFHTGDICYEASSAFREPNKTWRLSYWKLEFNLKTKINKIVSLFLVEKLLIKVLKKTWKNRVKVKRNLTVEGQLYLQEMDRIYYGYWIDPMTNMQSYAKACKAKKPVTPAMAF